MKRIVRVGVLVLGMATLAVPGALNPTVPLLPLHPGNPTLADGTQPPVPSGPMRPPANSARAFDGTQPPVPSGPMRPPVA
jgi:hypothetical protein